MGKGTSPYGPYRLFDGLGYVVPGATPGRFWWYSYPPPLFLFLRLINKSSLLKKKKLNFYEMPMTTNDFEFIPYFDFTLPDLKC
jgi:hypothetical protein